ncbi:MAG: LamG-like jellyroll fold domain-containing protein [Candidatus Paceibacterota bacterium]|jgi:hypothetical protein
MSSIFNIQKSFRISLGSPKLYAKGAVFVLAAVWLALPSAVSAATITASLKPAFQADLTSTLKLQAGSGSPTFTRATTAYVQDFEGVLRPVLSGEARFQGARRVRNRLLNTTGAAFSAGTGSSPTITSNSSTAPDGTLTATRVQMALNGGSTTNDRSGILFTIPNEGAGTVISSVWLKANSGSPTIQFRSALSVAGITLTNTWQRYAVPGTITVSESLYIWLRGAQGTSDSADISVWHPQVETTTTGQSNQNPSEYVSIGTLSAPYHGANVDGVKYFSTMNGNTVSSSYVVTEATGPAINSSTAKFAQLPGTSGSYFSTPDSSVNSITGDIDIRAYVALDDWTPSGNQAIIARDSTGQVSSTLYVDSTGLLNFYTSSDGTAVSTAVSSAAVGAANGTALWVRVTRAYATGAVLFYTSSDGATWTQLGTSRTNTAGAIFDSNQPILIGANGTGTTALFAGRIYHVQIYNGIAGTLAVNFNPNTWTSGSTWTAGTTGETWTINGGASVFGGTGLWDSAGPLGYFVEESRENLALQSNALTTTWLAVQSPSATQNVTGPDGVANSAWTLTDNSASLAEYVQQNITLTAATYTQSWYIKKTVGAQTSYPVMLANSNTKIAAATIDTTNGIATVWTAYTGFTVVTSSARCDSVSASWWRCQLTFASTAESWVHYAYPAGATSATQSSGTTDVAAQGSAVFYGGQVELGSFATSYIPTTTGSATRNADRLYYLDTGNFSDSAGTASLEAVGNYGGMTAADYTRFILSRTASGRMFYFPAGGSTVSVASYDGTTIGGVSGGSFSGALRKMSVSWSGSSSSMSYDGSVVGSVSYDGTMGTGVIDIGNNNGTSVWDGTIRNVKIWKKALTGSQLTTMTTSSTATSRAAIPQTTVKAPTKTGLVGAWTFDEGTGTKANDSSGTRNTGTLSGTTLPSWTTGKLGKALLFGISGTSYVSGGTNLGLSGDFSGTASAWIKRATGSSGTFQAVFVAGSAATLQSFGLGINGGSDGDVTIQFNGGKGRYSAGGLIPLNTWTHIAVTKTAGAIESTSHLYINGVEVTQTGGQTGTPNFVAGINNIGKWTTNGYEFNGLIDDVRVYNRALSAAEIAALYRSTATVVNTSTNTAGGSLTSGLTGLWSFDGKDMNWGVGNGALDRSGNGNNGLFSGMSTTTSPTIGKIGQALSFNGANGVTVSTASSINHGSGDFSVALWYKDGPTVVDANDLIGKGTGAFNVSGIGWELRTRTNDTALEFCVNGGGTCPRIVASGLTAKVWKHVVITVSRTNTLSTMYINGVSFGTMASAPTYTDVYGMTIGYGHDSLLNGKIDDVRLYNRALSATEAKALYNLGR